MTKHIRKIIVLIMVLIMAVTYSGPAAALAGGGGGASSGTAVKNDSGGSEANDSAEKKDEKKEKRKKDKTTDSDNPSDGKKASKASQNEKKTEKPDDSELCDDDPLSGVVSRKGLSRKAAAKSFNDGDKVSYEVKTGDWSQFNVEGIGYDYGWCAQAGHTSTSGKAEIRKLSNSTLVAKVAYYYGEKKGYNTKDGDYNDAHMIYKRAFATMIQYAYQGQEAIDVDSNYMSSYSLNMIKDDVDKLKSGGSISVTVPSNFKIYYADPTNSSQDFVFWMIEEEETETDGHLVLKKTASHAVYNYSSNLSLAGAEYYVYTDSECTSRAKDSSGNKITLTTKASGETNKVEVKKGTYYAKEIKASPGYILDTKVRTVKVTADNTSDNPATFNSVEEPESGHFTLKKSASSSGSELVKAAPGNYSLKGAVYYVYTDSACTKRAKDLNGNNITLTTDANGNTGSVKVEAGKYYAKEITAPKGFKLDSSISSVSITSASTQSSPAVFKSTDQPVWAGLFKLRKSSKSGRNGWYHLLGAAYRISYYDIDPSVTDVSGKKPVRTWTFETSKKTGDNGEAYAGIDFSSDEPVSGDAFFIENDRRIMPCGVFTIEEVKAPAGLARDTEVYYGKVYQPSGGAAAKLEIKVGTSGNLSIEKGTENDVVNSEEDMGIRIRIIKLDADTGTSEAQGQIDESRLEQPASLAGAVYKVYRYDYRSGATEEVGEIVTDESGCGELSKITTGSMAGERLDLGRYYVEETEAPPGYTLEDLYYSDSSDPIEKASWIANGGKHVIDATAKDTDADLSTYECVSLDRIHHTIIHKTDITNGKELPGATLQVLDADGTLIEQWISSDEPHDIKGLYNGKYMLREITAPYGYDIAEDIEFEVAAGKVTNEVTMKNRPVTIKTSASDADTNSNKGSMIEGEKIIDTVKMTGLQAGRKYLITGTIMSKTTGKPLKDASGNDVTSSAEFTATASEQTEKVEFVIDSSGFRENDSVVVYEKLYRTEKIRETEEAEMPVELSSHEDINNKDQSIYYEKEKKRPRIRTVAVDPGSGEHISNASDSITIRDTVTYSGLEAGKEYILKGTLHYKDKSSGKSRTLKSNGKPVTAETKFIPSGESGTEEVTFRFNGADLSGRTVVAFEELLEGKTVIASHSNINDEEQSVHIPDIGTEIGEKDGDLVADTVKYSNLIPNKVYRIKGYFVRKSDGSRIEGSEGGRVFRPEKSNGSIKVYLDPGDEDEDLVAFESVFLVKGEGDKSSEILIGEHKDLNDKDQTYSKRTSPKTGDDNNLSEYTALLIIAASILVILTAKRILSRCLKK